MMQLQRKLQKTAQIMYSARKKQQTNIFRGFHVKRKVRFMFWRSKDGTKGKCYVCSVFKQRNKVYLLCKLQQVRYGMCIFKLKCQKAVEKIYSGTSKKKEIRCRWCFLMLKCLLKGNNCIFGAAVKKVKSGLKRSSKKGQEWSES